MRQFYRIGYSIAMENSKALLRIADKAAEENEYGIACSLNVLAAEEAIKASVILTKHYNPLLDKKDFEEVFNNHKKKHLLIQLMTFLAKYMINSISEQYLKHKKIFDAVEQMPESERSKFKNQYRYFYEHIDWAKEQKLFIDSYEAAFKWWLHANDEKKFGLYTDLKNQKWHNPRHFSKEKYYQERLYSSTIINYIELFNKTFTPIKLLRQLIKIKIRL